MRHLTCLERLKIQLCPQLVFPRNMSGLTALRQLEVSGPNENILDGIKGIPALQNLSLDFFFPSLTSLSDWLGAMISLQVLKRHGFPKLCSLLDNFLLLRNLQKLFIPLVYIG